MILSYERGGPYLRRKLGSHKRCSYTPETIPTGADGPQSSISFVAGHSSSSHARSRADWASILVISWQLRKWTPMWVALGVGFGTLPGQLCFVCEALFAILLFWPIMLAILIRIPTRHVPIIFLLVISLFFTHPVSIILFAIAAGCAFVMTYRSQCRRIWMLMCAFGLSAMAILKSLMFLIFPSPYEISLLSMDVLKYSFYSISSWLTAHSCNMCMVCSIYDLYRTVTQ